MLKSKLLRGPIEVLRMAAEAALRCEAGDPTNDDRLAWLCKHTLADEVLHLNFDNDGGEILVSIQWTPREMVGLTIPGGKNAGMRGTVVDSDILDVLGVVARGCNIDGDLKYELRTGVHYDSVRNETGAVWRGFWVEAGWC